MERTFPSILISENPVFWNARTEFQRDDQCLTKERPIFSFIEQIV